MIKPEPELFPPEVQIWRVGQMIRVVTVRTLNFPGSRWATLCVNVFITLNAYNLAMGLCGPKILQTGEFKSLYVYVLLFISWHTENRKPLLHLYSNS